MPKAVFFDLDDTLVTHDTAIRNAAGKLFQKVVGTNKKEQSIFENNWIKLNRFWYRKFFNGEVSFQEHGRRKLNDALSPYDILLPEKSSDMLLTDYWEDYIRDCAMYDDVLPCLSQLAGLKTGIITNGEDTQQQRKIENSGLADRFDIIIISENVGFSKPDPEIFIYACDRIEIPANKCLYIGDDVEVDVIGANVAGLRGIWLDRKKSIKHHEVETIHSLKQLPLRIYSFSSFIS